MQRHQRHRAVAAVEVVGVGRQRHLLEKLHQRSAPEVAVELGGYADQLGHVPPRGRVGLVVLPERIGHCRPVDHGVDNPFDRPVDFGTQQLDQLGEGPGLFRGGGFQSGVGPAGTNVQDRLAGSPGAAGQAPDGSGPDAAGGDVDDAQAAHVVAGVGQHLQVRQNVLYLLAVVELDAAGDAVRNARPHERLLDRAREAVDAVEDGHRLAGHAAAAQLGDTVGDPCGLGLRVVAVDHADVPASGAAGPEGLLLAADVVGDQL